MTDFGGRYQLVRYLDKGAMGEVWLALDRELDDRRVAIKIMRSHVLEDAEGVARFQQELRLAARMQHPNIVTLFTSGVENGIPFMVMEYLQGHNLSRVPAGWGAAEIARAGRETCAALACAHGHDVVHRDIKPSNLFACDTALVKVTDFGVAKALTVSNATMTGTFAGTPPYMAPEQWLGRPATFAIDIWATGCTLYELLSGRRPREYSLPAEYVAAAVRGERVPSLMDVAGEVPPWLADAVMAMLEPDPASRPSAAECEELLSGEAARPAPSPGPRPHPVTQPEPGPFPPTVTVLKEDELVLPGPELEGHDPAQAIGQPVFCSSSSHLLVAVPVQGGARLWDTSTGRLAGPEVVSGHAGIPVLEFDSFGRHLCMVSGSRADVWDVGKRHFVSRPVITDGADLAVSPNARHVFTTSGTPLRVWNLSWPTRLSFNCHELRKRGSGNFYNAVVSADGRYLAASAANGSLYHWSTVNSSILCERRTRKRHLQFEGVAISPDGRIVAAIGGETGSSDLELTIWNARGKRSESWVVADGGYRRPGVYRMFFSPDGNTLAVNHGDKIDLWSMRGRNLLGSISLPSRGKIGTAFFLDGGRIAILEDGSDGGGVHIWDMKAMQMIGAPLKDPPMTITHAAIRGDLMATVGYQGPRPASNPDPEGRWSLRLWRVTRLIGRALEILGR